MLLPMMKGPAGTYTIPLGGSIEDAGRDAAANAIAVMLIAIILRGFNKSFIVR
ncbi:hypothetical protein GCM10009119_42330 [Algoriphagus jejuensis]|uniref:Uncharacterized protein n=1 Tax=Algoriphagus jejuensis TaxID=419934 RepID=A0ABP3YI39_9BACT